MEEIELFIYLSNQLRISKTRELEKKLLIKINKFILTNCFFFFEKKLVYYYDLAFSWQDHSVKSTISIFFDKVNNPFVVAECLLPWSSDLVITKPRMNLTRFLAYAPLLILSLLHLRPAHRSYSLKLQFISQIFLPLIVTLPCNIGVSRIVMHRDNSLTNTLNAYGFVIWFRWVRFLVLLVLSI